MSGEVRLRPEAEQDLTDAAEWYERQRRGLGQEFLDVMQAAFLAIAEAPRMYPVIHRNTRRAVVRRFPFGVHYLVTARA